MARKGTSNNGSTQLDDAMAALAQSTATLNQSMAALTQNQIGFLARMAETEKELATLRRQSDERFARIDKNIDAILHVLAEQGRLLERLPNALREKIGFKPLIEECPTRFATRLGRRCNRGAL